MNHIHKAGALIFSNKRMMIVRPKDRPYFLSPGGKYEASETAEECLGRELMEELSVKMKSFKPYKTYEIGKAATSNRPLKLELYLVEIDGEPKPSSEIEVIAWISKEDFDAKKYNLAPSFNQVIPDLIKEGFL
jgi:ADP-ribose pyrophosphatase YjhB (NUDIX family)